MIVLFNYAALQLLDSSFDATFALFLSTPIDMGGLSLSPYAIGMVLGLSGIFHGLFQAFFFAHIHKRWETRSIYAVSMVSYIPVYLCMPLMNTLARRAGYITPLIWTLLAILKLSCSCAYTAFSE